jgi:DNA-binding beta-propeller fold protein YncE
VATLLVVGAALAAASKQQGRIGPASGIQPTGRKLEPVGRKTKLGNFPTGGALTTNGRFLWTLSAGRARNDIRIVQVRADSPSRVGRIVQRIPMPGLSGGIAMAPDGRTAYVSGLPDSPHADQQAPPGVPGTEGDVIHVFKYDRRSGLTKRDGVIPVPVPNDAPAEQDFPPTTAKASWPRDLAISPDGKTLLAALNLADYAALIDTKTRAVSFVKVGAYPYGAAITRDGKFGLVSNEEDGTVSVIDLASATKTTDIQVAPRHSHAEGMATDPRADRAFVAVANQDLIAVIDTKHMNVARTLSVARPKGTGATPTQLSVTHDGCDLLSADSGEDAIAVFALSRRPGCDGLGVSHGRRAARVYKLVGRIPVASYPTAVAATPSRRKMAWVSARGLGVGPNPNGPDPRSPNDSDDNINSFQYLPSIVRGMSGILRFPTDPRIHDLTPIAARDIVPTNTQSPPSGTPVAAPGPGQKIKHVFYVVKENRTYDQVFGDIARGDGDPNLTLFGNHFTPNAHALARRFGVLDHVYADSEASIDGHYWTAAGAVSDYVTKNWPQNYAGRGRPYDFGAYEVSDPPKGYLFWRALDEGVSFFNYGEALAGLNPVLPDRNRNSEESARNSQVLSNSDIQINGGCYDGDIAIFNSPLGQGPTLVFDSSLPPGADPASHSRFTCFKTRFDAEVATNSVPDFSYIVLPLNHTQGVSPGNRTPDADVANNDWGLGQIVDEISHSSIWGSSLILVVEDDSQDGADHVDAHRIPALAISPYSKRGATIHDRYDQLSFLKTLEIIVGLKPQHLAEALAVPLYDAFTSTAQNSEPYTAITPNVDMTAVNPDTARNRRASAGLNLSGIDQIPQRRLDAILWRYRHGSGSPPPPGPNAAPERGSSADADG